jgi:hypothetical protein
MSPSVLNLFLWCNGEVVWCAVVGYASRMRPVSCHGRALLPRVQVPNAPAKMKDNKMVGDLNRAVVALLCALLEGCVDRHPCVCQNHVCQKHALCSQQRPVFLIVASICVVVAFAAELPCGTPPSLSCLHLPFI